MSPSTSFILIIFSLSFAYGSVPAPQSWKRHYPDTGYCPGVDQPVPPQHTSHDTMLPVYMLSNANFTSGTYRARSPGIYKLSEDILFNPNRESNWYPVCNGPGAQADYCGQYGPSDAYQLGFFAAIALEGEDQHLDLNGFSMAQHPEHALQQRFYANVELAGAPFVPNQGPATTGTFAEVLSSCKRCSVSNGVLGRSSHHGIHGNAAEDVEVTGVTFKDYEVAAISLNGASRVEISRCVAEGSFANIPTRGTYSGARFMQIIWGAVAAQLDPSSAAYIDIQAKSDALQARMDAVFEDIINGPTGHIQDAENIRQFGLAEVDGKRLVDGNSYGMVFHGQGVLIGPFTPSFFGEYSDKTTKDLRIVDTRIEETGGQIHEVVSMRSAVNNKPQVDMAGSVVRMSDILNTSDNSYIPDALHDMRFAIAYWSHENGGNDTALIAARADRRLGTFNIDLELALWARDGAALPSTPFLCNADTMHHKQKGVVGLFLQEVFRFSAERVSVTGTLNQGKQGSYICGQYWRDGNDGHDGYTGSQSRAVAVAGSRSLGFHDFRVNGAHAYYSSAYGMHLFNDVSKVCLNHASISNVTLLGDWQPDVNDARMEQYLVVDKTVRDFSAMRTDYAAEQSTASCV